MTLKSGSFPEQAWAHRHGRIQMRPHGASDVKRDPMSWLQIHEAFARFGIAHDEGRMDVLASLFTADAVLEVAEGKWPPFSIKQGRDTLIKTFGTVFAQQTDQRRHCMTNVCIERLTDYEAEAIAYGVVTTAANGLELGASVFYAAELRREPDGVWRFCRFFIGMDTYAGKKPDTMQG
jgi:hypothetical protein